MLCGQGVIAIWNGIAEEARAEFYAWHVSEHMPERVGIPGFLRGRRYRANDQTTHPEFFTLYELESFEVAASQDYLNRLNAPTPWTSKVTAAFRDTSRGLARVLVTVGRGPGGVLATIRFTASNAAGSPLSPALEVLIYEIARLPMITGAHLAASSVDASTVRTAESKGRSDIQAPPDWFVLVEACAPEALDEPIRRLENSDCILRPIIGRYVNEYSRLKMDWGPG
jgi:hypothetical protein